MSLAHVDTLISFAMVMLLLSLLIMAVIEGCNSLMMRRGRNLLWGITQVLVQMGMDSAAAKKLAQLVLTHPAISPSRKVPASSIRIDELAQIVSDLVEHETKLRAGGIDPTKVPDALKHAVPGLGSVAQDALVQAAKLRAWFDMIMDRTTERFISRTRSWTVLIAAALCVAFQIDSVNILQRLSTDDELRGALVASSGATLGDAEQSIIELDSSKTLATDALLDVRKELQASGEARQLELAQALEGDIAPLRTPFQAHEWLAQHVADESARAAIGARFDSAFEKRLDARLVRVKEVGATIAARLDQTQLDLLALQMPPWIGYVDAEGGFQWRHMWGVCASILLLSLGAPFWFNTLRNLSNLRPAVARKVDAEEKAQASATGDAKATADNK